MANKQGRPLKIALKDVFVLEKLYSEGQSSNDLAKIFSYKRTTIRDLIKRSGIIRTTSEAAKLSIKQGKRPYITNDFKNHGFKEKRLANLRKNCRRGSNHPCWIKDRTKVRSIRMWHSPETKLWRKSVLERDNYSCVICRKVGGKLDVHHIKSWKNYLELRFDVNNGITLCVDCHNIKHYGRIVSRVKTFKKFRSGIF